MRVELKSLGEFYRHHGQSAIPFLQLVEKAAARPSLAVNLRAIRTGQETRATFSTGC